MQVELEGRVALWVAVAYPIWQEIDLKAPDIINQATARCDGAVVTLMESAQEQGFPADVLPSGQLPAFQYVQCNTHERRCIDVSAVAEWSVTLSMHFIFPTELMRWEMSSLKCCLQGAATIWCSWRTAQRHFLQCL